MMTDRDILSPLTYWPSASYLSALPTLARAQADDLKIDTGRVRLWLSRVGVADGATFDNAVAVEKLRDGRWETVDVYPGGPLY